MSFLLFAVATAAAAATASYLALRRGRPDDEPSPGDDGEDLEAEAQANAQEGLPLGLLDVVQVEGEERWLSGMLALREGGHVIAALFFAPEGGRTESVLAFPEPRREIFLLRPVAGILHGSDPPTTIELSSITYRRRARRPAELESFGQGVPTLGPTAILAEYEGGGRSVAVVVRAEGEALTLVGTRFEPGEYDVLGGGGES